MAMSPRRTAQKSVTSVRDGTRQQGPTASWQGAVPPWQGALTRCSFPLVKGDRTRARHVSTPSSKATTRPRTRHKEAAVAPWQGATAHGRNEWAHWQELSASSRLIPPKNRFCHSATAQDSKMQLHLGKEPKCTHMEQLPLGHGRTRLGAARLHLIRKLLRCLTRATWKLQRRPSKMQLCTLAMSLRPIPPENRFCQSATAQESKVQLHFGKVHLHLDKVHSQGATSPWLRATAPGRGTLHPYFESYYDASHGQRESGSGALQRWSCAWAGRMGTLAMSLRPIPPKNWFCQSATAKDDKVQLHVGDVFAPHLAQKSFLSVSDGTRQQGATAPRQGAPLP